MFGVACLAAAARSRQQLSCQPQLHHHLHGTCRGVPWPLTVRVGLTEILLVKLRQRIHVVLLPLQAGKHKGGGHSTMCRPAGHAGNSGVQLWRMGMT